MSESVNEVDGMRRSDRGRGTASVKVEVKEEGEEGEMEQREGTAKWKRRGGRGKKASCRGKKSIMTPL